MTTILDDVIRLVTIYNLIHNHNGDKIDDKQFSQELRKTYCLSNLHSLTAGTLDEVLEVLEAFKCNSIQRRSAWSVDFVARLAILIDQI